MLASIYAELGESGTDVAGMAMMGELAAKYGDGRAMVLLGEYAYARGLPLDYYAYPTVGLPDYQPIAPPSRRPAPFSSPARGATSTRKAYRAAKRRALWKETLT